MIDWGVRGRGQLCL